MDSVDCRYLAEGRTMRDDVMMCAAWSAESDCHDLQSNMQLPGTSCHWHVPIKLSFKVSKAV